MNLVVTGATGFLGRPLVRHLKTMQHNVHIVSRGKSRKTSDDVIWVDGINSITDWVDSLVGSDVIIHCAARVHVMNETVNDPLEAFREVNVRGTIRLAEAAAQSGVKRFVFVSSIKVNGESTSGRAPYTAQDKPLPEDPYGISKAEAEEQLLKIGAETGMEIVIIRPPLVYGPGGKGNFSALCKLVSKGLPLPFGMIDSNKRSMVYVGNLVSLISECITNPKAADMVFLVSDNDDLSLADFIKRLSAAFEKRTLLLPVPEFLFSFIGKLIGKTAVVDRLVGSLHVDMTDTCNTLNWTPPYTVEDGFNETVKDFLK